MASALRSIYQWATASSGDKFKGQLTFTGSSFFLCSGAFVEGLIAVNILQSCKETFDCRTFWPTISYMAAYRGHDCLFNFTMTVLALLLPFFFLSAYTHYSQVLTPTSSRLILFASTLLSLLLPAIALIDEANSSHIAPLEKIHLWLMVAVMSAGTLWTMVSLSAMREVMPKLAKEQQRETQFLEKYVITGLMMLVVTIVEWELATSPYANWLLNENVEALCEWTVVTLSLFAPYFYSLTFQGFEFSFVSS